MKECNIDYSQEVIIQLLKLEGTCFSEIPQEEIVYRFFLFEMAK